MEQVKRYAGRAAALALACFVVAFSVSVPAAAAIPPDGNASMRVILEFQDDTYVDGSATIQYPYSTTGLYSPSITVPTDKYLTRSRTWLYFDELPAGETYRLRIRYRGFINADYTDITSQYVGVHYYDGIDYYPLAFTEVSLQTSFDSLGYIYDITLQLDLPVNTNLLRVVFYSYFTPYYTGGSASTGISMIDFLSIDPITDQSTADKEVVDRIEGSVNDKTQQSNQITNQIEQLQKPNVDSSSGKPVVGGMVVDPMQQVDRDSFNAYTNVLGTIFGSSTILGYFIIVFSLIFISYVIFGKSGG